MIRCWACKRLIVGADITSPDPALLTTQSVAVYLCGCGAQYRLTMERLSDRVPKLASVVSDEEAEKGKLWRGEDA